MAQSPPQTGNRLLDRLTGASYGRLGPNLRVVELEQNQVLYEARGKVDQIWFPSSCVTSAVTVMENGAAIEVATVGREGAVGLPALTVASVSPHRVFVQIAGKALVIHARRFYSIAKQDEAIGNLMALYHQAFLFQISQSVACNGLHFVSQRCCRWLLLTHDRVEEDTLALTHEFLSMMLGVRRATVTEVLRELQLRGLIQSKNGKIKVLDRKGLEEDSCECYRAVTDEYDRMLAANRRR